MQISDDIASKDLTSAMEALTKLSLHIYSLLSSLINNALIKLPTSSLPFVFPWAKRGSLITGLNVWYVRDEKLHI